MDNKYCIFKTYLISGIFFQKVTGILMLQNPLSYQINNKDVSLIEHK